VGLGLAGVVDSQRGLLRHSPFFGWRDLPLRDLLQSRLRAPVYVDNDVNTLTLSEKWFGAGQNIENFITLTIGRGLGMGMVINGQLYRGKSGGAGEFGHTVIDPDGPLCNCGRRGCLEAYVSDAGLLRAGEEAAACGDLPTAPTTLDELVALAQAGNAAARAVFNRAGDLLGRAVANLINTLDPEVILISGEGARLGDWLFAPMRAAISRHVVLGLAGDTEVRPHPWGDDAWARGAASLVLGELFRSPVHKEVAVAPVAP
jgi:N-acetylglucosamine repressor